MRNKWRLYRGAAAFGLVAGLLLAPGSATMAADEDQPAAARAGKAMQALASRPNCDNDSNVVAVRYLEKGPQGVRPVTDKCKGARTAESFDDVGDYDGDCDGPGKCSSVHPGDTIKVEIELPKSELGVSADEPVAAVISSVIVQVGESTCYWYCTGSGGSKSCEKLCD